MPLRLWVSGGLGAGSVGTFTNVASGWFNLGPLIGGIRYAYTGPFIGTGNARQDHATLIGLNKATNHFLALGALGLSNATVSQCSDQGGCHNTGSAQALAFAAEANANFYAVGIGLDFFGALGKGVSFDGVAISLQLGWFGSQR